MPTECICRFCFIHGIKSNYLPNTNIQQICRIRNDMSFLALDLGGLSANKYNTSSKQSNVLERSYSYNKTN